MVFVEIWSQFRLILIRLMNKKKSSIMNSYLWKILYESLKNNNLSIFICNCITLYYLCIFNESCNHWYLDHAGVSIFFVGAGFLGILPCRVGNISSFLTSKLVLLLGALLGPPRQ